MIFEYEHDGHLIECDFPIGKAPKSVQRDGKHYLRVYSAKVAIGGGTRLRKMYQFVSQQVDPWDPRAPRHTKDGLAEFRSKAEVEEFCARSKDGNDSTVWLNEGTRHGIPQSEHPKRTNR